MFDEIERLEINYSWFKLEQNTRRIVNALNALPEKISGRLKDKKDLLLVGNALRNLSRYLYSVIPELSSEDGGHQDVKVLGEQALIQFAQQIEELPPYIEEQRPPEEKQKASRKLILAFTWLAGLFSHESLLIRFSVWWVFSQSIALVVLRIALWFVPSLKLDSSLIVFAAGTPLLVAAAA